MSTTNTLFSYLYRDAGNYKQFGEIVFAGAPTDELLQRLEKTLSDHILFIARQVDVPEVSFEATGTYQRNIDDHPWHEFESMEPTEDPPDDARHRTIEELVTQFESASKAGWKPDRSWLGWW